MVNSSPLDNEFLVYFIDEASEILELWEKSCLQLSSEPNSDEAKESLYRSSHNLKSGSGAVGLKDINAFVHHVEDLISKILKDEVPPNSEVMDVLFQVHQIIVDWLENYRQKIDFDHETVTAPVKKDIDQILKAVSVPEENPGTIEQEDQASSESDLALEPPIENKDQTAVEQVASKELKVPDPEVISTEKIDPVATTEITNKSQPKESDSQEATRQNNKKLDHLPKKKASKSSESIRVAAEKLDDIIRLAGELNTQQSIVWHSKEVGSLTSEKSSHAIDLVQKIARDLHETALALRLQPLQPVFQRLERVAQDVSREQKKGVLVKIDGGHIELDRFVIERISDALLHIVRNAVDHGIESATERQKQAKIDKPELKIDVIQEASSVTITISDNGRGLDTDRILSKAQSLGLVGHDEKLTKEKIQRLIFNPGLSTASEVSDISGRGVGMNVVKDSIESIGGDISIQSVFGKGTSFKIKLPVTVSIIDVAIIDLNQIFYAIPLADIAEFIDVDQIQIHGKSDFETMQLRDKCIPLEYLADHLPRVMESQNVNAGQRQSRSVIVVKSENRFMGFRVDKIHYQQSVDVRALPQLLTSIEGYTAASIIGDGNPCIILNLPALASLFFSEIDKKDGFGFEVNQHLSGSDQWTHKVVSE